MTKGRSKKPYYFNTPTETTILTPFTVEEAAFICEHNPNQIPYERLDFSALNEEEQLHYSQEASYIESSPLTLEQKEYLSTSYVGATKLTGDGLLSSILNQEHTVAGELFEFSRTDLISAEIDPKTLNLKKD